MADYEKLIDAETWGFIRQTEGWYPPDTFEKGITEQRRIYDAMCRAFFRGYPDGVSATDRRANGVPVRHYQRDNPVVGVSVLYAHGGSYMLGGLDSHDDVCAEICDATGFDVVSVDYRLMPEHSRLDAQDDYQNALNWLRATRGHKIITAGDSAGGFISASVVHANRGGGDIIGQVLIYPGLGSMDVGGSMDEHANAPLLTKAEVMCLKDIFGDNAPGKRPKYPVPLDDTDLSGLPVTVAVSAQCDPIADHSKIYARAINAAGGTAYWLEDTGLVHGHLRARHTVKRARASFDRVLRAIALIGAGHPFDRADLK